MGMKDIVYWCICENPISEFSACRIVGKANQLSPLSQIIQEKDKEIQSSRKRIETPEKTTPARRKRRSATKEIQSSQEKNETPKKTKPAPRKRRSTNYLWNRTESAWRICWMYDFPNAITFYTSHGNPEDAWTALKSVILEETNVIARRPVKKVRFI